MRENTRNNLKGLGLLSVLILGFVAGCLVAYAGGVILTKGGTTALLGGFVLCMVGVIGAIASTGLFIVHGIDVATNLVASARGRDHEIYYL